MKIVLVRPARQSRKLVLEDGTGSKTFRSFFNRFSHYRIGIGNAVPPLALLVLAALTPASHSVNLMDEEVETIDFDVDADLVGITLLTATARRGYEIAAEFRKRGAKIVIGGMHATILPDEAAAYADAVVSGEVEEVWSQVLLDAKAGKLRRFYRGRPSCSMRNLAIARRELVSEQKYITLNLVQTTRGCPNRCSFCSIHAVAGRDYRARPVKKVIEEVASFSSRGLVFVDDNIVGDTAYAKRLFKALAPLDIWWFGQATLAIAQDRQLLALAAKSGCKGLVVGFESLSPVSIKKLGKSATNNVGAYADDIKKLRAHAIRVCGSFILGLDEDDTGVFEKTAEFIQDNRIDLPSVGPLVPLPGTRLFKRLELEGRLLRPVYWLDRPWEPDEILYEPKLMSTEALDEGCRFVRQRIYSLPAVARRLWPSRGGMSIDTALPVIAYNLKKRRVTRTLSKRRPRVSDNVFLPEAGPRVSEEP